MPKLPCPYGARCKDGPQGRVWETIDIDFAEAKLLLDDHQKSHQHTASSANSTALKAEKILRPQIKIKDSQIEEDAWEYFMHQWSTYNLSTNLMMTKKSKFFHPKRTHCLKKLKTLLRPATPTH